MEPTGKQRIAQLVSTAKICLQDLGNLSDDQKLPGRDEIPMLKQGKNLFANMLASLVGSFKLEEVGERDDGL